MKNLSIVLFLALCFTWSAGATQSEDEVASPDPVVVTVSAAAVPLSVTSASITVIRREEIESSGAETLPDLLRTLPGLDVIQNGSRGSLTTVAIRGAEENFTVVMIDGIPLNDQSSSMGGAVDISSLSLASIEQIEIVRGPMSALYGSEALGGVLNIITRRGEGGPSVRIQGQGGNFGSGGVEAALSGRNGRFDYSIGGSYFGISEQVENDDSSLGTIQLRTGWALADHSSLGFSLRYAEQENSGFPQNGGGADYSILRDPQRILSDDLIFGAQLEQKVGDKGILGVGFDSFNRDQDSNIPAILDAIPPGEGSLPSRVGTTEFSRHRVSADASWQLSNELTGTVSGRFIRETGRSDFMLADFLQSQFSDERNTGAVGGEIVYAGRSFSAFVGARVDKGQGFGGEVSPRLGVSWEFIPSLQLKSNYGKGFKLPSFFAYSDPLVGNSELRPERSRGFDIGLEHVLPGGRVSLEVTYFRNSFRDLIDFSPELFQLVNRKETMTQGVELEGRFQPADSFWIAGHVRYLDFDVRSSEEPLRNRPRWRGGLSMGWKPSERASLSLDSLWVGPRFDYQVPVPDRDVVGGYATTNLVGRYLLTANLTAFVRVDNLLNRSYHEFIGFPDPGLYARGGVEFTWNK
ncbi:MAG: TonB-dependent receptor [Acidobacteriota bacterium]|nr:MAG: TonB-dependent receptor [Acidobacteriota bacterium]